MFRRKMFFAGTIVLTIGGAYLGAPLLRSDVATAPAPSFAALLQDRHLSVATARQNASGRTQLVLKANATLYREAALLEGRTILAPHVHAGSAITIAFDGVWPGRVPPAAFNQIPDAFTIERWQKKRPDVIVTGTAQEQALIDEIEDRLVTSGLAPAPLNAAAAEWRAAEAAIEAQNEAIEARRAFIGERLADPIAAIAVNGKAATGAITIKGRFVDMRLGHLVLSGRVNEIGVLVEGSCAGLLGYGDAAETGDAHTRTITHASLIGTVDCEGLQTGVSVSFASPVTAARPN